MQNKLILSTVIMITLTACSSSGGNASTNDGVQPPANQSAQRPQTPNTQHQGNQQQGNKNQTPDSNGQNSGGNGQNPGGNGQNPGGNGQNPGGNGQNPGGNGQNPGGNGQNPGGNGQNPGGNGQNPGGNGQNPGGNGQNPGGNGQNPNVPNKPALELQGTAYSIKGSGASGRTFTGIKKGDITGTGNKLTIKIGNHSIDTEALRSAGGTTPKFEDMAGKSYRSFAVSDGKYTSQAFGYIWNDPDQNASNSNEYSSVFSAGAVTRVDDDVFTKPSKDNITYKGEAFIGRREDILKGTSTFTVNFADKKLHGDLSFKNGPKLKPGFHENTNLPENVTFDATIQGNRFTGTGMAKTKFFLSDKVKADGSFYGEGAKELGGTFAVEDTGNTTGSFGAIRQ